MKVLFLPEIRAYFNELTDILFEKEYFSFIESAEKYVNELFIDIKNTLPISPKRRAPEYFTRYGNNMFYSVFKKNSRTQWYVFFNIYENDGEKIYLVRYISNNHVIAHLI